MRMILAINHQLLDLPYISGSSQRLSWSNYIKKLDLVNMTNTEYNHFYQYTNSHYEALNTYIFSHFNTLKDNFTAMPAKEDDPFKNPNPAQEVFLNNVEIVKLLVHGFGFATEGEHALQIKLTDLNATVGQFDVPLMLKNDVERIRQVLPNYTPPAPIPTPTPAPTPAPKPKASGKSKPTAKPKPKATSKPTPASADTEAPAPAGPAIPAMPEVPPPATSAMPEVSPPAPPAIPDVTTSGPLHGSDHFDPVDSDISQSADPQFDQPDNSAQQLSASTTSNLGNSRPLTEVTRVTREEVLQKRAKEVAQIARAEEEKTIREGRAEMLKGMLKFTTGQSTKQDLEAFVKVWETSKHGRFGAINIMTK